MAKLSNGRALPGRLLIVEGIDGSGKSTQLDMLRKWLIGQGYCVAFSEWNSSPIVRNTTRRGKKKQLLTPTTFSLIHATDFADRYERQILPMLKGGYIVLCDRYVFTSFARDRVRGCDPQWLQELYSFAVKPDKVAASLERVRPRLTFLCNPNNPTGWIVPPEAVTSWAQAHPQTLFVVDEAYLAFAAGLRSALTSGANNVLVLRSMTKDYALAGLRLGYAVGHEAVITVALDPAAPLYFYQVAGHSCR